MAAVAAVAVLDAIAQNICIYIYIYICIKAYAYIKAQREIDRSIDLSMHSSIVFVVLDLSCLIVCSRGRGRRRRPGG